MNWRVDVAVQTPAHSALGDLLSYSSPAPARARGAGARAAGPPRGAGRGVGGASAGAGRRRGGADGAQALAAALDALPPLGAAWRDLVGFAARYYQRSLGEIALAALPPQLRDLTAVQLARRLKRQASAVKPIRAGRRARRVALSAEQAAALARFDAEAGPFLLFGSTGSGKTEVYLRAVAALLEREPAAQALVMVPEINLTPQLRRRASTPASAPARWSRCTAA